jgi:hypothetical protein
MVLTYRQQFLKAHGLAPDTTLSLPEISKLSKIPISALQEVERRGAGAWRTNIASVRVAKDFSKNPNTQAIPRSKRLGQEQWARARTYSFIMKGKTFYTADSDIAKEYGLLD